MSSRICSQLRALLSAGVVALVCVAGGRKANAAWDYGDGRHGSFVLVTNSTIEQVYQTVRLTSDPAQYDPSNPNAIPNFRNFTITNGAVLAANPWDGGSGGLIVFKVQGTCLVCSNSAISADSLGYQGGGWAYSGTWSAGIQGESYAGTPGVSQSANYGGGGGTGAVPGGVFGGGGGGYATSGIRGNINNGGSAWGAGGGTYGDP